MLIWIVQCSEDYCFFSESTDNDDGSLRGQGQTVLLQDRTEVLLRPTRAPLHVVVICFRHRFHNPLNGGGDLYICRTKEHRSYCYCRRLKIPNTQKHLFAQFGNGKMIRAPNHFNWSAQS